MSADVLIRLRSLVLSRRWPLSRSVWILSFFVAVGLFLGLVLNAAESHENGSLKLALGLLASAVLIALAVKAFRQGLSKMRQLPARWEWWHSLWLLLFASMLVFRVRDVAALNSNPLDSSAFFRVITEGLVAVALLLRLVLKKPNWIPTLFRGVVGAMGVYAAVCVISILWAFVPWWTAYRALEFLLDVSLLAAIVAGSESWLTHDRMLDWTVTFYGASLVGVWINVLIWPSEALADDRLSGVFPLEASNSVGTSGATLCLIALCRLLPSFKPVTDRAWYSAIFVLGMISMVLSKTRNVEASFLFSVCVLIFFSGPLRKLILAAGITLLPIVVSALLLYSHSLKGFSVRLMAFVQREQSVQAIDSLSGRTEWWQYGFEQLMKHPLTGVGAYGGRFAVLDKLGVGSAAMMHSDWVEVIIGTSFWGFFPFAAALVMSWYYLLRCVRSPQFTDDQRQLALEMVAILAMLTLHSFFNNELGWHVPLLYFCILGFAEWIRRNSNVSFGHTTSNSCIQI